MPNDTELIEAFRACAASAGDRLKFRALSVKEFTEEYRISTGSSRNPVLEFKVTVEGGETFTAVAFTLILDGTKRPATRVEALGRALGSDGGKLFDSNPFLLVFDYVGRQFMAVAAAALFEPFTRK